MLNILLLRSDVGLDIVLKNKILGPRKNDRNVLTLLYNAEDGRTPVCPALDVITGAFH